MVDLATNGNNSYLQIKFSIISLCSQLLFSLSFNLYPATITLLVFYLQRLPFILVLIAISTAVFPELGTHYLASKPQNTLLDHNFTVMINY